MEKMKKMPVQNVYVMRSISVDGLPHKVILGFLAQLSLLFQTRAMNDMLNTIPLIEDLSIVVTYNKSCFHQNQWQLVRKIQPSAKKCNSAIQLTHT